MSTDRELLTDAAKAAGIDQELIGLQDDYDKPAWNPLTDDGDALRLAVTLRLHVSIFADTIGVGTPGHGYVETKWAGDPYAATRRAIVRAAAELGRKS